MILPTALILPARQSARRKERSVGREAGVYDCDDGLEGVEERGLADNAAAVACCEAHSIYDDDDETHAEEGGHADLFG